MCLFIDNMDKQKKCMLWKANREHKQNKLISEEKLNHYSRK